MRPSPFQSTARGQASPPWGIAPGEEVEFAVAIPVRRFQHGIVILFENLRAPPSDRGRGELQDLAIGLDETPEVEFAISIRPHVLEEEDPIPGSPDEQV